MSSTYMYPSSVPDTANRRDRIDEPHHHSTTRDSQHQHPHQYQTQQHSHYIGPSTPAQTAHLSAYSPQQQSTSPSPSLNAHTPAESVLSVHYQSSELSEADDLFYGVNFNTIGGLSPSFLDEDFVLSDNRGPVDHQVLEAIDPVSTQHARPDTAYLPLSPDKTPSLSTASPKEEGKGEYATFPDLSLISVAPQQLSSSIQASFGPESHHSGHQLTPKTSNSENSSDNGLAPAAAIMHGQSPRVTVSHWDQENEEGLYGSDVNQQPPADVSTFSPIRDTAGRWVPDHATGQSGLDPARRTSSELPSLNESTKERELAQKNRKVDSWLQKHQAKLIEANKELPTTPNDGEDNIPDREIDARAGTMNIPKPGQTYYQEAGGEFTETDREIMHQNRNWADAPLPFHISDTRYQPATSQAAIERYSRQCRDNDSVVSRAATWGTRRRSLPSIMDIDVQAAGNFFKKLSLNRGEGRRPSILGGLRGLVRKPSVNMSKRPRGDFDDASSGGTESSLDRRDSQTKLAPPSPTPGWHRKNSVPSINTAFVAMGSSVAAIGTTHARSGSLSATPMTSPTPKSPSTLAVKKPLMNRLRSKSENQAPGIVDMWKKTGGPPVSNLGNARNGADLDDDDEEEDDLYEDSEMKAESNKLIDDITPNFAGFQQHVLKLNPQLSNTNNYLVDRIAHQQIVRYKSLLNYKVKHLQATATRTCSCASMCIALGGTANILDSKGDARGADPLSAKYDGSDGDITPLEGAINQESFPQDIPMPPTSTLPAEFECQLCYSAKKFQKPSDWTKHVHEDVQPFTCTWERCRDPKIFKRKADWVRHENEGHRHLEWWTCDVEDCRHICYRRDNFLQHLVREHKFPEPKVKTKAAIKKAGGNDPTWQKVEVCHQETRVQPQEEPCRFCGKTFPTWKKLTVHLAKHMEQISLPILKLVARKELDEDTIISPVQEPPPRQFPATFPTRQQQQYDPSPTMPQGPMVRQPGPMPYHNPQPGFMYQAVVPSGYAPPLHYSAYDDLAQSMGQTTMNMQPVGHPVSGFTTLNTQAFSGLPVTTSPYMTTPTNPYVSTPDIEPFPAMNMNALGLQDPGPQVQLGYGGNMLDIHSTDPNQYTPQGSVSPFSHSPHQPQGAFYPQ